MSRNAFANILLFISSLSSLVLISPPRIKVLITLLLIGVGVYYLSQKLRLIYIFSVISKIEQIISAILAVLLSTFLARNFYSNLTNDTNIISKLSRITIHASLLVKGLSYMLGFLSILVLMILIAHLIHSFVSIRYTSVFSFEEITGYIKYIPYIALTIIVSCILGFTLLSISYSLPNEKVKLNLVNSAKSVQDEGTYPRISSWFTSQQDNWTDAIILTSSDRLVDASTFELALLNYRGAISDKNPFECMIAHYANETPFSEIRSYPRYWHGYLLFVRPLLQFMDYKSIRILNAICQFSLLLIICYFLKKKNMVRYIMPTILTYALLMPIVIAKSLQFSPCYYIYSFGLIGVLHINETNTLKPILLFSLLGISTAFFDLLTYPLITLGIPLVLYLAIHRNSSIESKAVDYLKTSASWCIGYLGMWSSKWLISTVFTDQNVIRDSFSEIALRTSAAPTEGLSNVSFISCEAINLSSFLFTPISVIALIYVGIVLKSKYERLEIPFENYFVIFEKIMPYIMTGLIPFAWFALTRNHSSVHYWFTNKEFAILSFSFLCAIVDL